MGVDVCKTHSPEPLPVSCPFSSPDGRHGQEAKAADFLNLGFFVVAAAVTSMHALLDILQAVRSQQQSSELGFE